MDLSIRNFAVLIGAGIIGLAFALPQPSSIDTGSYKEEDIITRDVCIIGGGSTGTYSALRLGDFNKTVVIVEVKDRLGGHTETYIDPTTQIPVDYGVEVFHNLSIVTEYFARFNVPLAAAVFPPIPPQWVDFRTGKVDAAYTPASASALGAALAAYTAQLLKYPGLNGGYFLPDPVPDDLLMPFGDFVTKYSLQAAVYTIFQFSQSMGDILTTPTIYVMKVIGLDLVRSLQAGFLTTAHHDNSQLYQNAQAVLLPNLLLSSTVANMDRDSNGQVKVEVQTPNGRKLILAKKLLITIPPLVANLCNFDLSDTESDLFYQFNNVGYWTALTHNDGLSDDIQINNIGADTSNNLPVLPGIFSINPTGVSGLHAVKYGAASSLPDSYVQDAILDSIGRLSTGRADLGASSKATFAVFSSHTPYGLTVSADAIKNGFYTKLYALQGQRNTFWTGAAFTAHDSSLLWVFTEGILLAMAA
jgi:hypothetical protein